MPLTNSGMVPGPVRSGETGHPRDPAMGMGMLEGHDEHLSHSLSPDPSPPGHPRTPTRDQVSYQSYWTMQRWTGRLPGSRPMASRPRIRAMMTPLRLLRLSGVMHRKTGTGKGWGNADVTRDRY